MKIAIISTTGDALTVAARAFLPKLIEGLTEKRHEVHLFTDEAGRPDFAPDTASAELRHEYVLDASAPPEPAAAALGRQVNEMNPHVYLIWAADDRGWLVLPQLAPPIATLAVGHADSEIYYRPARHYRAFLTRVIGTTPETSVGFVISCVIDKERVEWISFEEGAAAQAENDRELIETYLICFEKAVADAHAAPREAMADFTPLKTARPPAESWLSRLKARILK